MTKRKSPITGSQKFLVPVILLLVLFAQITNTGIQTSMTIDEPLHVASGYACLTTGDYRLVEEHPPLLKMLQAVPLLWLDPPLPDVTTVPGWESSDLIEVARNTVIAYRPIDRLVFPARVPTMLLSIILAAFVFRWAKDMLGITGANLALLLYVFDPNILAHSAVAATDISAVWGIFVTSYFFWRWIRRDTPRWPNAIVTGIILGLALGVKLTVLILGPIFVLFVFFRTRDSRLWLRTMLQAIAIVAIAFYVLWAIYGFEFGPIPELPFPIPFPSHMLPIRRLLSHIDIGHSAFLMGENYTFGDWRYFPIAFALKTPLLTLGLLGVSLILLSASLFHKKVRASQAYRFTYLMLLSVPALYFGMSVTSAINIGYRHLLPILPFVFILCADAMLWLLRILNKYYNHRVLQIGIPALLLCIYGINTLRIEPWQLTYFNLIAGGPENGYRYLADSNLDWGQAWKALARYQHENHIKEMYFSTWSFNNPKAYDITYTPLTPWPQAEPMLADRFEPAPGTYAISATQLQGVVVALPEMFDYFRHQEPIARPGLAIHIYEIPNSPPADWIAQCNTPVTLLTEEMILEGFRSEQARRMSFDCTQSWLVPPGKGFTVMPYAGTSVYATLGSDQNMRLDFSQDYPALAPAFSIFERTAAMALPVPMVDVGSNKLILDETLQYKGYSLVQEEQTITVYTFWMILETPASALSLMAHIRNEVGDTVGVADGLGVSNTELFPGSLLIQKHEYPSELAQSGQAFTLWFGAYSWPDLVRYPITMNGEPVGDVYDAGSLDLD